MMSLSLVKILHGSTRENFLTRYWKQIPTANTVEPVLGDHPFCPAKTVAQGRWSLITGRTKITFYLLSDMCTSVFTHSQAVGLSESTSIITCWKEEQAIYLQNNKLLVENSRLKLITQVLRIFSEYIPRCPSCFLSDIELKSQSPRIFEL